MIDVSALGLPEGVIEKLSGIILDSPPHKGVRALGYEGGTLGEQLRDALTAHQTREEDPTSLRSTNVQAAVFAIGTEFITIFSARIPPEIPDNAATMAAIDGVWHNIIESMGVNPKEVDIQTPALPEGKLGGTSPQSAPSQGSSIKTVNPGKYL